MTEIEVAELLVSRWEGFRSVPYLCPAGVPTIGFGFTRYANGRAVQLSDPPITREHARVLLRFFILRQYLPAVRRLCPEIDDPERLGAIVDFAFNLGTGNLKTSTLRKKIQARDWEAVPEQLRRWNKAAGRVLRGLTLRREAEIAYL